VACLVIGLVVLALVVRPRLAVALVFVFFSVLAVKNVVPRSATNVDVPVYRELAARSPRTVAYDLDHRTVIGYFGLPFWLNRSDFVEFHSSSGDWPDAQLYVGPVTWPAAVDRGLERVAVDRVTAQGYWAAATADGR